MTTVLRMAILAALVSELCVPAPGRAGAPASPAARLDALAGSASIPAAGGRGLASLPGGALEAMPGSPVGPPGLIQVTEGAPAPRPATGTRPMTREEELRLAAEVVQELWNDPAHGAGRLALLATLAMADLDAAERLAAALPEQQQAGAREQIACGLLRTDPERALARLDVVPSGSYTTLYLLRELARQRSPAAPALLARVIQGVEQALPAKTSIDYLAGVAAAAQRLKDPRARALADAALQGTSELHRQAKAGQAQMQAFRSAVEVLVPVAPEEALRMSETLPGTRERMWLWERAVAHTARRDPAKARALLEERRDDLEKGPNDVLRWSRAARWVCAVIAEKDIAAAGVFARTIPQDRERAIALMELSRRLPEERAGAVRREALRAALESYGVGDWEALLHIAEATPRGPEQRYTCALALQMAGVSESWRNSADRAVRVAVLLAPEDPEAARALLEDGIENHDEARSPGLHRTFASRAIVLLDPRRAVEVARGIAPPDRRIWALGSIARALAEPPETRLEATGLLQYRRDWDEDLF